jgi:hypothetical protein
VGTPESDELSSEFSRGKDCRGPHARKGSSGGLRWDGDGAGEPGRRSPAAAVAAASIPVKGRHVQGDERTGEVEWDLVVVKGQPLGGGCKWRGELGDGCAHGATAELKWRSGRRRPRVHARGEARRLL